MLGFVSLGSAYMLVSVGVTIYRRRNAVPSGAPIGALASPAELQGCLEELSVVEQALERHLENFHNLLAHYDADEAQRWSESESFWLGQWKAAGERCRFGERRKGPLAKSWEELRVIYDELKNTEATYTKELQRFAQHQAPRLDQMRERLEIGGPTHRHHHRRASFWSHTHHDRSIQSDIAHIPPRPTDLRPTPIEAAVAAAAAADAAPDAAAPAADAAPRRARRARPSPSWACTPTCCAPSTRWASPNRCPCSRRPSRRSRPARDLMVQSRTGSGKTAAFGIPFANGIVNGEDKFVQAIILLPTRELALQVAAELAKICQHRQITVVPVYGGAPMGRQVEQLRAGGQIVCGTPGRVLDHLRRGTLQLDRVRCAVLDECDEMLSMGFQEDIEAILEKTPTARQTLLFSATVPEEIQRLARRFLRAPEFLKLSGDYVSVHEIQHVYYSIPGIQREEELLRILDFEEPEVGDHLLQHARGDRPGRRVPARQGPRRRGDLVGPDAERSRARARPHARGRHQVPGRDRRRGARHRHREPVARLQLHVPRGARDLHPPHRPHRPRRPQGDRDLADRPHRGRVVLLPEAALQDQTGGALAAVGGGDPIAPRGRAGARCCAGRSTGDPGAEWRALARRLVSAVDGERLVAALLAHSYASVEGMPVVPKPRPAPAIADRQRRAAARRAPEPRERERESGDWDRDRGRGDRDRDRPRFGGRDRGPRDRGRPGERDRPRFGDRDRERGRGPRPGPAPSAGPGAEPGPAPSQVQAPVQVRRRSQVRLGRRPADDRHGRRHERRPPPPLRNDQPPAEREFWEVWSEERAQAEERRRTAAGRRTEPGAGAVRDDVARHRQPATAARTAARATATRPPATWPACT